MKTFILCLLLTGCGSLNDDEARSVVKKCADISGIPYMHKGFNGKADVDCTEIKP